MIKLLIKKFIKNYENVSDKDVREKYGVLGGVLGIICNLILFGVKISIGAIMNSIAIISDAFNNFSDMGSSLVAIVSAKMSNRGADREHPFGHGRIEYVSSLIVSFLIIMVGFELFKSSFSKIIMPEEVEFKWSLILILVISMSIKIWMFSYNKYIGKTINSSIMNANAYDSLNDVLSTGAVVIATVAGHFISIPIDGLMGIIVSGFIMYTGIKLAREIIGVILGTPPSREVVNKLTSLVLSGEGIVGVHDLIIHDYGPGRSFASIHAEVPDNIDIVKTHEIIDMIEQKASTELDMLLVIHMDPISVNCEKTNKLKEIVAEIAVGINKEFSIHDFRMVDGENNINLIFDLVVPVEMKLEERKSVVKQITEKLHKVDVRYNAVIQVESSYEG